MTRRYGRAPRGERVTEGVPRNYGTQTSLIGAISLSGVEAVMTVEGAVDTGVFDAYVEQVLRRSCRPRRQRARYSDAGMGRDRIHLGAARHPPD
jgi:hypothetical protein